MASGAGRAVDVADWLPPVFAEYLPRLDELLCRRREEIIDRGTDWIRQLSTDLRDKRPRPETRELVSQNFDGFYMMMIHGDTGARDTFIEFVTGYRSALEFKVSTLLRGFMTFKVGFEAVLVEEEENPVEARKLRDMVDSAYFDSCFLVSDVYASKLRARLHDTEAELMQREKQAALGRLVAGVAHEINTPIGVAVTAASLVRDQVNEVERAFHAQKLKKSGIVAFFANAREAADLALINLDRAAKLVRSFKLVAVDQSSEERRTVRLGAYMGEVLASLGPLYRRTSLHVRLEVDTEVELSVMPGAISQIVTNLVSNAITHGFEPGEPGEIVVRLSRADDGAALIECQDSGRGIARELEHQVFEPFYTTRRGMGGSGLGLHIVHNLVTELLGGEIVLETAPGQGCRFQVRIPPGLTAP